LLEHTINVFQRVTEIAETVIAAAGRSGKRFETYGAKNKWRHVRVVRGGKTRAESVYKALVKTNERNPLVFVHDGARPFVSNAAIEKLFQASTKFDAVLLGKKVVPTLKENFAKWPGEEDCRPQRPLRGRNPAGDAPQTLVEGIPGSATGVGSDR